VVKNFLVHQTSCVAPKFTTEAHRGEGTEARSKNYDCSSDFPNPISDFRLLISAPNLGLDSFVLGVIPLDKMKRKLIILSLASSILLSCQKEVSMSDNNGTVLIDDAALLVKTFDESANGSITTEYKYDVSKKLVSERTSMTNTSVGTRTSSLYFYRDGLGRIIKTAHKYDQPIDNILYDTVVTSVIYETAISNKIVYSKTSTTANGITVYDSTRYAYNVDGKITRTEHFTYRQDDLPTIPPRRSNYFNWQYDATGNLIKMEQYSDFSGSGVFQLEIAYLFEYDNKINPYYSGDDIRLESDWYSASPNNVIKQTIQISQTREQYDNLISYDQYDGIGRPMTATHTPAWAPTVRTTFFYQ
jgi:hypothetical protein